MTEPTPFPASPYCRVRARVASIWADGPDDGTHPDWRPAAGEKVTLTPSIGSQLLTYDVAGPEPIIVTVERVECVVDEDGWLSKADGRPVFIAPTDDPLLSAVGWTWTASIKGKTVVFAAPSGGVVDLAVFIAAPATDDTKVWVERIPELVALIEAGSDPAVLAAAVEDYLAANPPASAPDATTATKGIVELATTAETTAGTDTTRAVTPAGVAAAVAGVGGGVTDHGALNGLDDDDHPQYALADGTRGAFAPPLGADDNYVTDAEKATLHSHANKTALDAVSGVNTGDQDLSGYATTASLSTVATSGAYADLTGTPTIPDSPGDIGAAPATHDHTAADIGSGAAIDGHILTADGAGGAVWGAPPAGGGGGGRTLLATQAATGTAVTFSNIPQTYAAIRVEWSASNTINGGKTRALTVNGDTGENYATSGNGGGQSSIPVLAPQSGGQSAWIEIIDYATQKNQIVSGQSVGSTNAGNSNIALTLIGGSWLGGASVVSLTFTPSHANDECTYRLYGLD